MSFGTAESLDPIPGSPETDVERARRIRLESAIIAQARADIDAGLGIKDADMEAWFDELGHNASAPLPDSGYPLRHS